jgi:hypothetical protein
MIQFNGHISIQFPQLIRVDRNKALYYDTDSGLLLYKAEKERYKYLPKSHLKFDELHAQHTNLKKLLRILKSYNGYEFRLTNKEQSAIKLIERQLNAKTNNANKTTFRLPRLLKTRLLKTRLLKNKTIRWPFTR